MPLQLTSLLVALVIPLSAFGAFRLVRARITRPAAQVIPATVAIDTRPAGAELMIDGRHVGATPLTVSVAPGTHTFTLHGASEERKATITLAPGAQVTQYLELKADSPVAATGRLSIITDPSGARVSIDGRPSGISPVVLEFVAATPHKVTVTTDAGSAEREVTIRRGVTEEMVFSLPRPSGPVGGWVAVNSAFAVDVLEHAEIVGTTGTTGATKIMLPAGRHDVVLRNDDLAFKAERRIDIAAGRVTSLAVVPPKAKVNVNARPWANVDIDGVSLGQTPLANIALPLGSHEITFRHPELGTRTQTIIVKATGSNRVAIDLTK